MRRFASLVLAAGFLFVVTSAAHSQPTEIRGAAITLVPTTVVVERVTIENRRSSPLVAWEIQLPAPDGSDVITRSDFVLQMLPRGAHTSSIRPNEQRTIEVPLPGGGTADAATVRLAVFEDGHIDGVPAVVQRWQRERQQHVEDAAYWIRALESMPRDSEERAKQYLAARIAERPAPGSSVAAGVRGRVIEFGQPLSASAPGELFARVDRIRQEAEAHLARLGRPLTSPQVLEPATPVLVSSNRTVRTDYVASIVNHRDIAIEAVGFEVLDAGEDRPTSGHSSDFCLSDSVAGGRIAAGHTREFPLSTGIDDTSRLPTLRLTFVLFDDLSFEGSPVERDRLFQRREHQADDMAFANRVRMEIAALPADAVEAFLMEKRTERTRQLLAQGRRSDVRLLDEMIEQAGRSPEGLREAAPAITASVEMQRLRLLRHTR